MEIQVTQAMPETGAYPALRAFKHRNFQLFFTGQTISMLGTWSQMLAISWLVWRLTHSPLWLGLIGFATQLPMLIFGLPGGAIADRFDRRKTLNFMQMLCMLQALILALLTLTDIVKLWEIVVLSISLGIVYAFEFPIRQSFVMDMVGKRDLLNAVALVSASFHATRIIGPVAAGAIVAWKGEGECFLFNAGTFLFLIAALFLIDKKTLIHPDRKQQPLWTAIKEGLADLWGRREAKLALVILTVSAGIGMQFTTLMPIFADRVFGGGARLLGWLMGAGGIGSLTGALWLARRHTADGLLHLTTKTAVVFSAALIIFSILKNFWIALPVLTILGFFLTITLSGINTLLQHISPDHLRGRAMSIMNMMFVGIWPFGSLAAGFSAREIGAPPTLLACGIICCITAFVVWLMTIRSS